MAANSSAYVFVSLRHPITFSTCSRWIGDGFCKKVERMLAEWAISGRVIMDGYMILLNQHGTGRRGFPEVWLARHT